MTNYQFEVLYQLYKNPDSNQRELAELCNCSLGNINKNYNILLEKGYVSNNNLTCKGKKELDKYKVDNAIIFAAGMSTRFAPFSYEIPKGLTVVKGEVLIERQIRQLKEAGVEEIILVLGHMLEKFLYLKDKYGVKFVVNKDYSTKNTYSSLYVAREYVSNTYICCSDNYYPNNLFKSHEYRAMYCTSYMEGVHSSERGVITNKDGLIIDTTKPANNQYGMVGHAYFDKEFSKKYMPILEEYIHRPGTDYMYWEMIYAEHVKELSLYEKRCKNDEILEFDSIDELKDFDPNYIVNNSIKLIENICKVLKCNPIDIKDIFLIQKGLTNKSFGFTVNNNKYVYRFPGNNSDGLVDRKREKKALEIACKLNIDSSYIYEDEKEGWKLSKYIDITEEFDYSNDFHAIKLCKIIHTLNESNMKCNSNFDYFKESEKLLNEIKKINRHTFDNLFELNNDMKLLNEELINDNWPVLLCHNDIYEDNLLISKDNLYLIDWEYSGDSDIGFDICKIFNKSNLSLETINERLKIYYGREAKYEEKMHILGCATISFYYWFLWGLFQVQTGANYSEYTLKYSDLMNKYREMRKEIKESY